MHVVDFHFDLPGVLIARHLLPERHTGRLLALDGPTGTFIHRQFTDPLGYLHPGDLIVLSNTRAIPARLFNQRESGDKLEVLIERVLDQHRALVRICVSKTPKPGMWILIGGGGSAGILQRHGALSEFAFAEPVLPSLEWVGYTPLPPYIDQPDDAANREHYQTVCIQYTGVVAAPVTGLRFDEVLLEVIRTKRVDTIFVTLHIGAGTFQPVHTKYIEDHVMHREWLEASQDVVGAIPACRARGDRVVTVGTTSVRSLENITRNGELKPFSGDADTFIFPDQPFRMVDVLVINSRLPESTSLILVPAFTGYPETMAVYVAAVIQGYRFFSYGDAMFITRNLAPRRPED